MLDLTGEEYLTLARLIYESAGDVPWQRRRNAYYWMSQHRYLRPMRDYSACGFHCCQAQGEVIHDDEPCIVASIADLLARGVHVDIER